MEMDSDYLWKQVLFWTQSRSELTEKCYNKNLIGSCLYPDLIKMVEENLDISYPFSNRANFLDNIVREPFKYWQHSEFPKKAFNDYLGSLQLDDYIVNLNNREKTLNLMDKEENLIFEHFDEFWKIYKNYI